jgi:hypothetical protein
MREIYSNKIHSGIALGKEVEAVKTVPMSSEADIPLTISQWIPSAKLCTTTVLTSSPNTNLQPFSDLLRGPNTW